LFLLANLKTLPVRNSWWCMKESEEKENQLTYLVVLKNWLQETNGCERVSNLITEGKSVHSKFNVSVVVKLVIKKS
jgi:hypothetical protein